MIVRHVAVTKAHKNLLSNAKCKLFPNITHDCDTFHGIMIDKFGAFAASLGQNEILEDFLAISF